MTDHRSAKLRPRQACIEVVAALHQPSSSEVDHDAIRLSGLDEVQLKGGKAEPDSGLRAPAMELPLSPSWQRLLVEQACRRESDGTPLPVLMEFAMPPYDIELTACAAHIAQRRGAILRAWRAAVTSDPALTTGASLPRAQLHDHIPALLVDFERRLASGQAGMSPDGQDFQKGDAAAHGLHRWQQGFDLEEVTRELARLNECVVSELETYAAAHPALDHAVMALVRKIWAQQCGANVIASTTQYFRLQQIEASSHIKDLEQALESLQELEAQRAQLWKEVAHDLRGNLGVVANATVGLRSVNVDVARDTFLRLLDRNVSALHHLLNDVTSLARLQGGQEHRSVERVDVAVLLRDLCEGLQAQARDRNLFLSFDGPSTLSVQADAVKTRRITQNLVLNAIKYTRQGGVSVSWGESDSNDADRWFLQVQDTGPGFHAGPGSQLAGALEAATDQAKQVQSDGSSGEVTHASGEVPEVHPSSRDPRAVYQQAGEGIGLSIVKRLCELLDATVELESKVDAGTTVRILLPRRYGD
jgi:signal transduction histidine kinase